MTFSSKPFNNYQPSDIRYIDPKTGAVTHTETVQSFRKRTSKLVKRNIEFLDPTETVELHDNIPTDPNQYYRVLFNEVVAVMNLQDTPNKDILKAVFLENLTMEETAKKYDRTYDNVRQIVSRFRTTARDKVEYTEGL